MSQNNPSLNHSSSVAKYLALSFLFLLLSALGIYFLFFILPQSKDMDPLPSLPTSTPTPLITLAPDNQNDASPSSELDTSLSPTQALPSLTQAPTPTPAFSSFTPESALFTAQYSSDRQVYQDKEASGLRYTFYRKDGNIALHVGTDWSWSHPQRVFTSDLSVSGLDTFLYKINTQTIVDFQTPDTKYTIQCVHNAQPELIQECDLFLSSFKLN